MPRPVTCRPIPRRPVAVPLLLVCALALAGCASSDDTSADSAAGGGAAGAPEPEAPGTDGPADGGDATGDGRDDAQEDEEAGEPDEDEQGDAGHPDPAEVGANELGEIPVLMYHRLLDGGGGDYDLTPDEFRAELEWLYEHDFRPVRMADVAAGEIDLPAGMSPVVLTFDDSTREQFALDEDGEVRPDTKVGILEEFGERHDDWDATAASFYVITSSLFGGGTRGEDLLRDLADRGYEIGNHTHGHTNLRQVSDDEARAELAEAAGIIEEVTGTAATTLSLPFGIRPQNPAVAGEGESDGVAYAHTAVLLVGAGPAPSPFASEWDPLGVPRIRSSPSWEGGEPDWGSAFWLQVLLDNPERRYVSDGDPDTISFPEALADSLHPDFEDRANPY